MDNKARLKDLSTLKLSESLHLCRAEAEEWVRYFHVYYHQATIAFGCNDPADSLLAGRDQPYWLMKDHHMVGGLAMTPFAFRYLFAIPPFQADAGVIKLIAQAIRRVAGGEAPIRALDIPDDDADDYIRAGFRPDPCRFRWMRRPAAVFSDDSPAPLIWRRAEIVCDSGETRLNLEREAGLFLYKHAHGEGSGEKTSASFSQTLQRIREYAARSPKAVLDASGAAYDRATHAMIGVCLIGISEGCPAIEALAVGQAFRGRGVATDMLQRALTVLAQNGEALLRIRILHGHPIESLCYRLGFMPGPLFIPEMTFARS